MGRIEAEHSGQHPKIRNLGSFLEVYEALSVSQAIDIYPTLDSVRRLTETVFRRRQTLVDQESSGASSDKELQEYSRWAEEFLRRQQQEMKANSSAALQKLYTDIEDFLRDSRSMVKNDPHKQTASEVALVSEEPDNRPKCHGLQQEMANIFHRLENDIPKSLNIEEYFMDNPERGTQDRYYRYKPSSHWGETLEVTLITNQGQPSQIRFKRSQRVMHGDTYWGNLEEEIILYPQGTFEVSMNHDPSSVSPYTYGRTSILFHNRTTDDEVTKEGFHKIVQMIQGLTKRVPVVQITDQADQAAEDEAW